MSLYRPFHPLHRRSPHHHHSSNLNISNMQLLRLQLPTFAPAGSPFWTEKCRLASPSVTNERREWPLALSGISPANTAARRISLCCGPSHPFGCERTKSIWDLTEFHKLRPLAWVSWIYPEAHSKRYLRKSAKTSTTVLLSGSGGNSSPMQRPAPTFDLRCSLNLWGIINEM